MTEFDSLQDLGAEIEGLTKNGFPRTVRVTSDTKAVNGLKLLSKFSSSEFPHDPKGKVVAEVHSDRLALDITGQLDTKNKAKFGIELTDWVKNTTIGMAIGQFVDMDKRISKTDLEGCLKFRRDTVGVIVASSYDLESRHIPPVVEAGAVLEYPKDIYWSVGGKTCSLKGELKNELKTHVDFRGSLSYRTNKAEYNFIATHEKESARITLKWNWLQRLADNLVYGAMFSSSVDSEKYNTETVVVGEYKVDQLSTIKAKSTTTAVEGKPSIWRFGLGLSHKINDGCVFTVGADLNMKHLFRPVPSSDTPLLIGFEVQLL